MTGNRKYRDEDWLREQYVEKKQSTLEIAEICGCDPQTIGNWLKKHNIKTRVASPAADQRLTDPDWLYNEHVEKEHSTTEIANKCDCHPSTVRDWFEKHDIENRTRIPDERLKDPDWLHKQYVERGQSAEEIANICNCSYSPVFCWLRKHGIETRDFREALPTGNNHHNWKGGENPYGEGWSIGKKRKVRERDDHICQDPSCSVTQADHLDEYGEKLHVHHLRKARDVDDPAERNAKQNLITLCRDCHTRWEKMADAGLVPQLARDTAN